VAAAFHSCPVLAEGAQQPDVDSARSRGGCSTAALGRTRAAFGGIALFTDTSPADRRRCRPRATRGIRARRAAGCRDQQRNPRLGSVVVPRGIPRESPSTPTNETHDHRLGDARRPGIRNRSSTAARRGPDGWYQGVQPPGHLCRRMSPPCGLAYRWEDPCASVVGHRGGSWGSCRPRAEAVTRCRGREIAMCPGRRPSGEGRCRLGRAGRSTRTERPRARAT